MMEVHNGYENLCFREPVITMGMFDGVHRGHRMLLNRVVRESLVSGSDSVAVTFNPHPRIVLTGDPSHLRFLTDLDERITLLHETGLQHLVVIPFTRELSMMTASEFLKEVLCNHLGVRHLVAGFNHHFGRKHEGTSDTITECSQQMGFTVSREDALMIDGIPVSSSLIREKLTGGDIERASTLLGYNYFISGRVISGNRIGRNIGFPTANIEPVFAYKLVPGDGVYAVEATIEGDPGRHIAMLNIGTRPTIDDKERRRTIEAHIIDFEGDLYGTVINVRFRYRLRDEMRFGNIDSLSAQLGDDRARTISLLGK